MQSGADRHLLEGTPCCRCLSVRCFPALPQPVPVPPISHHPRALVPQTSGRVAPSCFFSTEYLGAPVSAGLFLFLKRPSRGSFGRNERTSCTPRHPDALGLSGLPRFSRSRARACMQAALSVLAVEGRADADPCRHRPMTSGSFYRSGSSMLLRRKFTPLGLAECAQQTRGFLSFRHHVASAVGHRAAGCAVRSVTQLTRGGPGRPPVPSQPSCEGPAPWQTHDWRAHCTQRVQGARSGPAKSRWDTGRNRASPAPGG